MVSKTELTVRYAETDQMSIVHHSNYPIWYEAGRTDFIKGLGMTYTEVEAQGVLLPLLELHCKYIQAAKYEDEIIVETRVSGLSVVKIEFSYKVYRKRDGVLLNTGSTVHGMVTKELRPIHMKKEKPELYDMLQGALEQ
ncbi:MAG: acyl-CoA thioesterase [Lachnospiraceae bacterium]|nr:acyl-CoA thioesterase [Lachnospiraceae bacterium]